jgi:general secretion pathway protein G
VRPSALPRRGFTVVELLVAIALIGVLATMAGMHLFHRLQAAKLVRAMGDLRSLEGEIDAFILEFGFLPGSLEEVVNGVPSDPWGRPYEYLAFQGEGWQGRVRRDRFLIPLNTAYDLYSVGPDGESRAPLPPPVSWDDVIRANDGFFLGQASDF